MSYVRGDRLPDRISLFNLDCDDFQSHVCALDIDLHTPKYGCTSAQERFVNMCGIHWNMFSGCAFLLTAAGADLPFVRLDRKYTFCCWLAFTVEESLPRFRSEFFHLRRDSDNVSHSITDKVHARPSLLVDFKNF